MPPHVSSPCPQARSACPIATALDLVGDKWTLLVIRDLLFLGKRRFNELLSSPEGIPTNILTDRLRRLEDCGLVVKVAYQARPPRHEYHLTPMGADLLPVLTALVGWANRHLPGTAKPPPGLMEKAAEAVRNLLDGPGPDGKENRKQAEAPTELGDDRAAKQPRHVARGASPGKGR